MEIYFTDHELTKPYTCGKMIEDFTMDELKNLMPELTEEEKTSPFASYFYEKMADLDEEQEEGAQRPPLRPDQCYMPEEIGNIILDRKDGTEECPSIGYGVMDNGVGYAAMKIVLPGITDEMVKKYREEFAHTEDNRNVFYKVWFPGNHYLHCKNGVVEDFGWGPLRCEMNWELFRFKHIGITREEIAQRDPECISFLGLAGDAVELGEPDAKPWPMFMVSYTRLTESGREMLVHYWKGIQVNDDGTITLRVSEDREDTLKKMKIMMMHCMLEYMNEGRLIREFWNKSGDK